MRKSGIALLALWACVALRGQTTGSQLEFEVASIKQAPPRRVGEPVGTMGCFGGPGSRDPIRFVCSKSTVSAMVLYAYDLKAYQLRPSGSGDTTEFNVEARVPLGTTPEQVKRMLRGLLAQRFHLVSHHQKTEAQGYVLVVAKSGLKMKEAGVPAASLEKDASAAPPGPVKDRDGFVYIPRRKAMVVGWANGLTRWVGNEVPLDSLTGLLNSLTGRPVTDGTGLKGNYDFTLTFSPDSAGAPPVAGGGDAVQLDNAGLSLFAAVEEQLGLKLEPGKIMIDLFVIDHTERTPVEN